MAKPNCTSEVHVAQIQIEAPGKRYPHGKTALGCYTVDEKGLLTMCDGEGKPVLDDDGTAYTQQLRQGDSALLIAQRLTRKLREVIRDGNAPKHGFAGPIAYSPAKRV